MAFVLRMWYHRTNNHIVTQDFAAAVRTLPKSLSILINTIKPYHLFKSLRMLRLALSIVFVCIEARYICVVLSES